MLSALLDIENGYDADISPAFETKDEARAVVAYGLAVAAYEDGDVASMRKNISDAFWFHPEQAALFAKLVNLYKAGLFRVDIERPITDHKGDLTTLKEQIGDNKAILLDFWASWCEPCIALWPGLKKRAEYLKDFDIVVAGMNTDEKDRLSNTTKIYLEQNITFPWLSDSLLDPLQADLKITSIPRAVLISPEGAVLFDGHPEAPELWTALREFASDLKPQ